MTEEKKVKIYREIKCSERLPDKEDEYWVIKNVGKHKSLEHFIPNYYPELWIEQNEYWLEPIEIKVIEVEESDSKKILPKEERLSGTEITDLKDGILEAQLMYKYIKAIV
jgi:hypothetical protein